MAARLIVNEESHAFGTADDVFFTFWKTGATESAVRQLFVHLDRHIEARGSARVLVTVYEGIELPSREAQSAISRGLERHADALKGGVAISIEGTGIGAHLGRSVSRTINVFSRQKYPSRVFSGPETAIRWLASIARLSLGMGDYRELRRRVDSGAPADTA